MKKSKILVSGTVLLGLGLGIFSPVVKAEEIQRDNQTFYKVESGDTLSEIGKKYDLTYNVIHANNVDTVLDANLIFVGQEILVGGEGFNKDKVLDLPVTIQAVEPVVTNEVEVEVTQEPVVSTPAPVQEAVVVSTNDGSPQYAAERMAQATGTSVSTWLYIIKAESSDNPHIVNSIGCYGYFQIHPVHGMPYGASVDTQIEYAIQIYNTQGFGAWEVMR